VAIVHERFTEMGGSELVVEQLHAIWPDAAVHAAVIDPDVLPGTLRHADLHPSRLQRLYRGGTGYAHLLPLLPFAMSHLELGDVELVVTSHHAFANRVRPETGIPVISYTHTPARWIWEPGMRAGEIGGRLGRLGLTALAATQRRPDVTAARRLRGLVVNSRHVAARARRWWGREGVVVPPPVAVQDFTPDATIGREDFFLLAGRMVPYKRPEVAVAAALRAGVRLVAVGEGRSRPAVEAAAGPGIELVARADKDQLRDLYRRCRALVFPGEEDFGIVPVEAQACGAPVLAWGYGGVLDSVVDGVTGQLVRPQAGEDRVAAMARAIGTFDPDRYDGAVIRRHAETFSPEAFRARFQASLEDMLWQG
jgi:glycosyltransferase involved in cell wall biosynthesis